MPARRRPVAPTRGEIVDRSGPARWAVPPGAAALLAAGYTVFAVNPLQAARYRDRLAVSRAKSDAADAHMLADMVRTDSHQLRPIAGDSSRVEAVKVRPGRTRR